VLEQEASTTRSPTRADLSGRLVAYTVAAVAAGLGTLVLAVAMLAPRSSAREDAAPGTPEAATGFILFEEFHSTLFVSPGATGENGLDVVLARHDGSELTGVSSVTVAVSEPGGASLGELEARPLAESPGTFRVAHLSIPSAGDWEFALSVGAGEGEPVRDTTVIPIGAP
jgi:hypothetical protein